jgi:hypothetical protein
MLDLDDLVPHVDKGGSPHVRLSGGLGQAHRPQIGARQQKQTRHATGGGDFSAKQSRIVPY